MSRSWVTNGKLFSAAQSEQKSLRQQFAARRSALWANEHVHAGLTATTLLLAALAGKWAGLSIARQLHALLSLVLILADVRTWISKYD